MASSASSDALGFPVRGMPKTVREKNIIFNVIKYFEDEKERHGKQKLIVIDNAPYHSRNDETYPVSKWKKQQYIDWLKSKDIAVPKKILRAELWTMCKQERDRYPAKIVESIAKNAGHETLRLPPHH